MIDVPGVLGLRLARLRIDGHAADGIPDHIVRTRAGVRLLVACVTLMRCVIMLHGRLLTDTIRTPSSCRKVNTDFPPRKRLEAGRQSLWQL